MDNQFILKHTDHTLLKQDATWAQVEEICKEAIEFQTASVCIPPSYVTRAKAFLQGRIPVCTVVGFPNGYQTTATKIYETHDAIVNGADEIDMVINVGWVKDACYEAIRMEIAMVKQACEGRILKVIIETSLLTEAEKMELCHIIADSDADYIKTSTGFAGGGATISDIQLFEKEVLASGTKIKAAGGIKSLQDAEDFLKAGAHRLGSSSLVGMVAKQ